MENINACQDYPRALDYNYSELMGYAGVEDLKVSEIPRKHLIVRNQSDAPITKMACTRYSPTHIINAQLLMEHINKGFNPENADQVDPKPIWIEDGEETPGIIQNGDLLQRGVLSLKNRDLLGGFGTVQGLEETLTAIARGHYIATGSNDGNWVKVREEGIYEPAGKTTSGHAFPLIGYDIDKRVFIGLNSYGPDNGYFEMSFDHLDTLFSRLAILPRDFNSIINNYKMERDKKTIETAIKNNIYNGERENEPVTREEATLMVTRSLVLSLQKSTYSDKTFDEILDILLNT